MSNALGVVPVTKSKTTIIMQHAVVKSENKQTTSSSAGINSGA
jgi:hypothetical protein